MKKIFFEQKGVALYLTLLLASLLVALALGLSAFVILQLRMIKGLENSVIAFYAADTGVERALYEIKRIEISSSPPPIPNFTEIPLDGASFTSQIRCKADLPLADCDFGYDINCTVGVYLYCVKSTGTFGQTRRAIEAID